MRCKEIAANKLYQGYSIPTHRMIFEQFPVECLKPSPIKTETSLNIIEVLYEISCSNLFKWFITNGYWGCR